MAQPKGTPPTPRRRERRVTLASALKAAQKAGASRVEVDPRTGRITILLDGAPAENLSEPNPCDRLFLDLGDEPRAPRKRS